MTTGLSGISTVEIGPAIPALSRRLEGIICIGGAERFIAVIEVRMPQFRIPKPQRSL